MRNVLLVDSSRSADPGLVDLLKSLKDDNYSFYLFLGRELDDFGDEGWNGKRFFFGPRIRGTFGGSAFFALWPFLWLSFLLKLISLKKKSRIDRVLLVNDNEKLLFSSLGRFLRLKVFWLEMPENGNSKRSFILRHFLRKASKKAVIMTFTRARGASLEAMGASKDNIKNISLGINIYSHELQDDIFSNLAKNDDNYPRIKRFTVGAVANLDKRSYMENIFRALQLCVNMIPQLQVVVIGEGEERKNLNWLAKRMELDKIIWFVGRQENIRKWMDNFSVYAAINEDLGLVDMNIILEAMSCSLPVIGFKDEKLEGVIDNGVNGFLVKPGDADTLARKIVMLEQDYIMRSNFGKRAKQRTEERFSRKRQIDSINSIMDHEDNI